MLVRIGLLTDGGFPYAKGESVSKRCGLPAALRSEAAVRLLEAACRIPGARRSMHTASVPDLRPAAYGGCGGSVTLSGLLAKRFFGAIQRLTAEVTPGGAAGAHVGRDNPVPLGAYAGAGERDV
ncbi:hypothetical protein ACIRQP_05410 [Streptomyces sp. NPDC102274]|uniref:hypothetical protein n=1 Tax=Streptomyces sp. NPDC102274 TaxID=3366151 RepID=UPI003821AF1D